MGRREHGRSGQRRSALGSREREPETNDLDSITYCLCELGADHLEETEARAVRMN